MPQERRVCGWAAVSAATLALLGEQGCAGELPQDCLGTFLWEGQVRVVDAATHAPICNAMVNAQRGAMMLTLHLVTGNDMNGKPAGSCWFEGFKDGKLGGPSEWLVSASAAGYVTKTQPVDVPWDAPTCEVTGVDATIELQPQ